MTSGFSLARLFIAILLFSFMTAGLHAGSASPKKYRNGVYINRIYNFDIKKGTAEVDFWYWFVSEDSSATLQNLDLSNGKLQPLGEVITQKGKGLYYLSRRYVAEVQCLLELDRFPFDRQRIVLSFEDGDLTSDLMVFTPDRINSGIDSAVSLNEWEVNKIEYQVGNHHYPSSFGDLDLPTGEGSDYSQLNVIVTVARRGSIWQKLFKYFWAVAVSVFVGLFSLLIRVCDLDGRFGMAAGALFANVGCSFLLSDHLPESPSVSFAEWISFISLGFIMVFLIESIVSLAIYNRGNTLLSRRLDLSTFFVSLACYAAVWCLFI